MKIAVIGAGMIGSAAARHLAKAGYETVLIGPREPADQTMHKGVFASHYDAGRITRRIDPSAFWARASEASLARYDEILSESGIPFYTQSGLLMTAPEGHSEISSTIDVAHAMDVPFEHLKAAALNQQFPNFEFFDGEEGLFESEVAGHIDPRALVQAQIKAAEKHGAQIIQDEAREVFEQGGQVVVSTSKARIDADQVLLAMGGFAQMLAPEPLGLTVRPRTIVLAEVSAQEAAKLSDMPPLIRYFADGTDMYMLPPIRYPDGRFYFKIGGDPVDLQLAGTEEIKTWFRSGGSADVAVYLEKRMREVLRDVSLGQMHMSACVTTFTDNDRPLLKRLNDRVTVATAGCGKGAKCSDEIGRLGAELVVGRDLPGWAQR